MSREHEFAIYRRDELLAVGTARELAHTYGVTPEYIKYLSTPTYQRRMSRTRKQPSNARYTIKLGPADDC